MVRDARMAVAAPSRGQVHADKEVMGSANDAVAVANVASMEENSKLGEEDLQECGERDEETIIENGGEWDPAERASGAPKSSNMVNGNGDSHPTVNDETDSNSAILVEAATSNDLHDIGDTMIAAGIAAAAARNNCV